MKNRYTTTKIGRSIFIITFLLPTLIAFCLFYLYPIVTVFFTSFTKWDYQNITKPVVYPLNQLFENYHYIFTVYPYFGEAIRNSFKWALCGLCIQMPLSAAVAVVLSQQLPGWKFTRNIYIVPSIISSAAMGFIFLQLYNPRYGALMQAVRFFKPDFSESILLVEGVNFWAMTASYIFFTGTTTVMILGQIAAIPKEIYEAAVIDGAGALRRLFMITLPSIKGILKTAAILAATSGFLLYNEVYFLTKGAAGTRSISFIIRELAIESSRAQYARANTVGVIQILGGMIIILGISMLFSIDFSRLRATERKHDEK